MTQACISNRLKALGKILKLGKWLPHELTECQRMQRKITCEMLIARYERKSFLHRIVTGDEKWIFFDNPKRSSGWVDAGQAGPSSTRPNRFGKKTMLCLFWDLKGLVYYELLQSGKQLTRFVTNNN